MRPARLLFVPGRFDAFRAVAINTARPSASSCAIVWTTLRKPAAWRGAGSADA